MAGGRAKFPPHYWLQRVRILRRSSSDPAKSVVSSTNGSGSGATQWRGLKHQHLGGSVARARCAGVSSCYRSRKPEIHALSGDCCTLVPQERRAEVKAGLFGHGNQHRLFMLGLPGGLPDAAAVQLPKSQPGPARPRPKWMEYRSKLPAPRARPPTPSIIPAGTSAESRAHRVVDISTLLRAHEDGSPADDAPADSQGVFSQGSTRYHYPQPGTLTSAIANGLPL